MSTTPDPFLTLDAAADLLGLSRRTLARWVTDGTLPAYRFGPRAIRVRLSAVEALARPVPAVRR